MHIVNMLQWRQFTMYIQAVCSWPLLIPWLECSCFYSYWGASNNKYLYMIWVFVGKNIGYPHLLMLCRPLSKGAIWLGFALFLGRLFTSGQSIHAPKFSLGCCPHDYQWPMKSNRPFVRNEVTVIYSHAILVAVMSECHVKRVITCKPGLGHWQTVQTQIRPRGYKTFFMLSS